jgi:hypothetical protein
MEVMGFLNIFVIVFFNQSNRLEFELPETFVITISLKINYLNNINICIISYMPTCHIILIRN